MRVRDRADFLQALAFKDTVKHKARSYFSKAARIGRAIHPAQHPTHAACAASGPRGPLRWILAWFVTSRVILTMFGVIASLMLGRMRPSGWRWLENVPTLYLVLARVSEESRFHRPRIHSGSASTRADDSHQA